MLQSMAAYNSMLKIKISKYLHIYLEHLLEPHNRIVYKSIEEILDGNELALEEKVKLEYIKNLIRTFGDSTSDPADLQFLSKLCLCNNRTVKKNQDAVFKAFYGSNENKNNKFEFKEDHGNYLVSSRVSESQDARFRTLFELHRECEMFQSDGVLDQSKGHWNYFMQYLNLLADVCVNRNSTPLDYISKNLPLKMLEKFLHEKLTRSELLHQPFVRLVHHAFVETEKYKEISRITKVKDWNTLGDQNEIPRSSSPVSPELKNIMQLVIEYISKINLLPW
jgi:inositol 1,4,5-triphosphate receptor type 1/inositol 1,4,5-triphosphate receptor type 3